MKKSLVLLLILIAVFLTACGSGSSNSNENHSENIENSSENHSENIENSSNNLFFENAEYITADQTLTGWSVFENGRAWVQHGVFDTTTALIDKEGKVLWESDAEVIEVSDIRDGFAYCKIVGEEYDTYILLDSDGNVTFTKDCDENYIILGHGNGQFLVAEHVLSFDTNEWRLGTIDKNGNTVIPFQTYETSSPLGVNPASYEARTIRFDEDYYYRCSYVGDGVFELFFMHEEYRFWMVQVLLNIETQSVIFTYDTHNDYSMIDMEFISDFENGSATVLLDEGTYGATICTLSLDGTLMYDENEDEELIGDFGITLSDGLICDGKKYYSIDGECVIDFPQYQGKYDYSCGAFVNGYAFMNIEGADGNNYITAIDKNGEFMFEPMSGFGAVLWNDDNYLVSRNENCLTIFDINGNKVYSIQCECISEISVLPIGAVWLTQNIETSFGDGMLGIKDFYLNLETGTVIGKHQDDMTITKY